MNQLHVIGVVQPVGPFCMLQLKPRSDLNENDKDEKKSFQCNWVMAVTPRRYRERWKIGIGGIARGRMFTSDVFLSWHVLLVSVHTLDSYLGRRNRGLTAVHPNNFLGLIIILVLSLAEVWPGLDAAVPANACLWCMCQSARYYCLAQYPRVIIADCMHCIYRPRTYYYSRLVLYLVICGYCHYLSECF